MEWKISVVVLEPLHERENKRAASESLLNTVKAGYNEIQREWEFISTITVLRIIRVFTSRCHVRIGRKIPRER